MENLLNSIKKFFNKPWKIVVICLLALLMVNQTVDSATGVNIVEQSVKKVLAYFRIFTEETKSVEMESELYSSEGHGHYGVVKSADWTSTTTSYVQFDISTEMKYLNRNKDVVFILDTSGSMAGEKIAMIQAHAKMLTSKLLDDPKNSIALIRFDEDAEILSRFTNDKTGIDEVIDNIELGGNTNYYAALLKLREVLRGYRQKPNTDLIVMFLSDGYPNVYNPNQTAQYKLLKKKFPYMVIQGIQYEMGIDVVEDIKKISDNQFVIDLKTVNNILFEAVYDQEYYEGFEIVDYIDGDYWKLNSVDDVEVPFGTVLLTEEEGIQKVTWTVGPDQWRTGQKATMRMNLVLKEQYVGSEGYYPTNLQENFGAKLYGQEPIPLTSDLTPVLKAGYNVNYHTNVPSGCTNSDFSETHFAFQNVELTETVPVCEGYVFKGYEFASKHGDSIQMINSDVFIMPTNDVDLYGTWSKVSIAKDVSGSIVQKFTLYNHIASLSKGTDANIDYTKTPAQSSTNGVYQIDGTGTDGSQAVYFYRGTAEKTKNNLVFADICWLIIRTTDTGGVKLLYNGLRDPVDGSCLAYNESYNTADSTVHKQDHTIGQSQWTSSYNSLGTYQGYTYNASKLYPITYGTMGTRTYATTATWDATNKVYKLTGTASQTLINAIKNKRHYACTSSSTATSCASVYFVAGYNTDSTTYTHRITLSGGDTIDTAFNYVKGAGLTKSNQTDSLAKQYMDNWYETHEDAAELRNLSYMLEDTPFCNDRSISNAGRSGWRSSVTTTTAKVEFSTYTRAMAGTPTHACSANDKYTVNKEYGNGLLDYPMGLMTVDEMMYAGGVWNKGIGPSDSEMSSWYVFLDGNSSSSTNSGNTFNQMTLSPGTYSGSNAAVAESHFEKIIAGNKGEVSSYNLTFTGWSSVAHSGYSLRPVISLKEGTMLLGGTGTTSDPYVVVT